MTKEEVSRQFFLIEGLLNGVAASEALKPDLPFLGTKLKWLTTRVIPRFFEQPNDFDRTTFLAEAARLQQRWASLYFEHPSPETVVSSRIAQSAGPWTDAERRFIESEGGFDDTAFTLLVVWGRIPQEARSDGRWVVCMPGSNAYDAALIRERLGKVGSSQGLHGLHQIAEESILLSAGLGVRVDQFDETALNLAPLVPELYSSEEPPANVVWKLASRLIEQGCLQLGPPAHRPGRPAEPGVLHLTRSGFERASSALHAWWPFSKESGYSGRQREPTRLLTPREDDIPF
jgi:hypothetical protein